MADLKLKAGTTRTLEANGGAITDGDAGVADDADFNNATDLAEFVDFELNCGFASSVSTEKAILLYLVPKLDATNAADADTTTPKFQPDHYAGSFITATTGTSARRLTVQRVPVGPYAYTARLLNRSGQTISAGWALKAFPVIHQSV